MSEMAPESERAKESSCTLCGANLLREVGDPRLGKPLYDIWYSKTLLCRDGRAHISDAYGNAPKPNEPTLTCSEVVERLAAEVADELLDKWPTFLLTDEQVKKHIAEIVRTHSTAILHSWRERRVQELENLLAKHSISPEPQSTQLDTGKEK